MIKLIGSLLIIFSSTAFGFIYGEKLKKRTYHLKEIQRAVYQIRNEITYTCTPLPETFFNTAYKSNFPINKFLKKIEELLTSNEVNSVNDAFIIAFDCVKEDLSITKEDKDVLLNLGKGLGESDIEGQKKVFSLTLDNLKNQIIEADMCAKKNIKMYRYLGFTLGAMIVIMLI